MAQARGITVAVDNSPPQKLSGGRWQINVWAVAQQRGRERQPASGERIEFFVDGTKEWESETENDGRTPAEIVAVPPEKDAVTIEAQPAGDATRRSKKVVRREEKPKKPGEIRIYRRNAEMGGWRYSIITVRAFDEEEELLRNLPVFLRDPEADPDIKQVGNLDLDGLLTFEVLIQTERKEIVVMVGNKSKLHLIYC